MGKKMKLPFLSNNTDSRSSWPWPSCHQIRTLSFRNDDGTFKTINSACLDAAAPIDAVDTPESWFTTSSGSASFSTMSEDSGGDSVETVIRGLRSERLFFEPGETSSILEEAKPGGSPFKESVALSMESQDPYVDFRKSMEEMVEAHGLKDWEGLEELLCCYLRVNGKGNHGYIVGAFVDLLVGLAFAATSTITTTSCSCSCSHSSSSPLSFYTSSSSCSIEVEEDSDNSPSLSSLLEAKNEVSEKQDDVNDDAAS